MTTAPTSTPGVASGTDAAAPSARYRLLRQPPQQANPTRPDADQADVVRQPGGPRLVLAGPGTGKTTTLVEAVTERVRRGTDPERMLVLTFSRKAAVELRDQLAARQDQLPQPSATVPHASTFHSFCYALVRAHQNPELFSYPLRLLSGPEQDVMLRELLAGEAADARAGRAAVRWPDDLRSCLTTRGFADEVRAVLARSRELGLGPDALARFADHTGRPDWRAAADFLAGYLDVLDQRGVLDYPELVHRAVLLAETPDIRAQLRARYDAVFVDEYQDTDPAQVRLLRALAGDGRDLVAFGDPDQSIYAFRGADVNGILEFREDFPRGDGQPADISVLRTAHRFGAALLHASRQVAHRMPTQRLPAAQLRAHREPAPAYDGGQVEVYRYPTPGAEVDNIADLLRRAHLEDGVAWSDMAVLVRSGGRSLPSLRRALTSAGVPLDVDGDDLPLRAEPAVSPLLLALRCAALGARSGTRGAAQGTAEGAPEVASQDAADADAWLTVEHARTLLLSPLGGMDPADLRRLGRELRELERAAQQTRAAPRDVPSSDELVRQALLQPERLVTLDPGYARGAQRLGALLRDAGTLLAGGGTTEQALWQLWSGTPWPQRLERAALRGGAGGRNADRDLDAVCALFETAERAEERTGGQGALNFLAELDAQNIAADLLSGRTVRPDAVRLLTAHRAKGQQWRFVVVAGVQEGLWPDLRRRGSLLEADRIGREGIAEPLTPKALLAEERRLFYVATTRARQRLVVTAVRAPAEDGDQPSRFLDELGVPPVDVGSRPRRPLSVSALVAELRATTVDPEATPALRTAAARRLARLAALRDTEGFPLVPAADPERWWGLLEQTQPEVPVADPERPVRLTASGLEQLAQCPLQWFLSTQVHAERPSTSAQGFGSVVHALADEVASGHTPADLEVLLERLDTVWDSLAFDAPWKSTQEREEARAALGRFLRWHVAERSRTVLASEHPYDVTLRAGETRVRVHGSMDRVERGADSLAYIVDFKTGRNEPTQAAVAEHPQLAVYQRAAQAGALRDLQDAEGAEELDVGGAELVQLRSATGELPKVQRQEALAPAPTGQASGPEEWPDRHNQAAQPEQAEESREQRIEQLLADAARRVLAERFVPQTGERCRNCGLKRACSARPEGQQLVQ